MSTTCTLTDAEISEAIAFGCRIVKDGYACTLEMDTCENDVRRYVSIHDGQGTQIFSIYKTRGIYQVILHDYGVSQANTLAAAFEATRLALEAHELVHHSDQIGTRSRCR